MTKTEANLKSKLATAQASSASQNVRNFGSVDFDDDDDEQIAGLNDNPDSVSTPFDTADAAESSAKSLGSSRRGQRKSRYSQHDNLNDGFDDDSDG